MAGTKGGGKKAAATRRFNAGKITAQRRDAIYREVARSGGKSAKRK